MTRRTQWCANFLAGGAIILSYIGIDAKDRHMPENDSNNNRMEVLLQQPRTICIGRFLVDVPKDAEIIYGPARVPVVLVRMPGDADKLDAFISDVLLQIETLRSRAYRGLVSTDSVLGQVIDGIRPNHKIVFGIGKADGAFYNVQSFFKVGNDLFLQEYDVFGDGKRYEEAVQKANIAASRVRVRSEGEIPSESGVCVDGAFIAGAGSPMAEAVTLGIRLKRFNDVHLSIEMTKKNYVVQSDALEPRLKAAEQEAVRSGDGAWYAAIKTIRRGRRTIEKWTGYEMLARKPAQGREQESHEFVFLSQGEPKNPLLPVMEIEMHTGVSGNIVGGKEPSIGDMEAVYLWDKITGSIRARPVSNPSP